MPQFASPDTASEPRRRTDRNATTRVLPSLDTIQLVADESRRAILAALWRADDAPLRFSELRRRADIRDSGRFNYHLQQLLERCVRETDEGYALTARGEEFVAALRSVPTLEDASAAGVCAER